MVCCLFGGVGAADGETDISGQCVKLLEPVQGGEKITLEDVCRIAGLGHCLDASGDFLAREDEDCGGWNGGTNVGSENCSKILTVQSGHTAKAVTVEHLICDVRGWGILTPPKNVPDDFRGAVMNATNWLLGFVGMIAVLMIIWGGINYLTAAGDEEKARTAKKIITYGLMGVVIAGLAYAMVTVIVTVILK